MLYLRRLATFQKLSVIPTFRNAIFKRDDEGIEFLPFQVFPPVHICTKSYDFVLVCTQF